MRLFRSRGLRRSFPFLLMALLGLGSLGVADHWCDRKDKDELIIHIPHSLFGMFSVSLRLHEIKCDIDAILVSIIPVFIETISNRYDENTFVEHAASNFHINRYRGPPSLFRIL